MDFNGEKVGFPEKKKYNAVGKSAGAASVPPVTDPVTDDSSSAWETFKRIRDSVDEKPYPTYRGDDRHEFDVNNEKVQNRLIRNREAQEQRDLEAKQWEWKRKYGSQRDVLKRELMSKLLGVSADMLAPEPYPVAKNKPVGLSERDMTAYLRKDRAESGFKADNLDAAERGQRNTTSATLTGNEMNRVANIQSRKDQYEANRDARIVAAKEQADARRYVVDQENSLKKEKMVKDILTEAAKNEEMAVQMFVNMAPKDLKSLAEKRAWAEEQAAGYIMKRYQPIFKEFGIVR
jgi:hypothetical protein